MLWGIGLICWLSGSDVIMDRVSFSFDDYLLTQLTEWWFMVTFMLTSVERGDVYE